MYVDEMDFINKLTWSDKGLLLSKLCDFKELNILNVLIIYMLRVK
jgi:hypothetical protein